MAVLTMDTSTQALAVAVGNGDVPLVASASLVPRGHSRLLQPTIAAHLHSVQLKPTDLTSLAVGIGPGSYTGVRLAVATAKSMAVTLAIPVVGVPTLAALAECALPGTSRQPTYVMSLLYARRERAFGSIYRKTGVQWNCVADTEVLQVSEWMDKLYGFTANTEDASSIIVHDFSSRFDAATNRALEMSRSFVGTELRLADIAAGIGPAMLRIAERQDFGCTPRNGEDVHALVPDYALRVEAEVKQGEGSTTNGTSGTV